MSDDPYPAASDDEGGLKCGSIQLRGLQFCEKGGLPRKRVPRASQRIQHVALSFCGALLSRLMRAFVGLFDAFIRCNHGGLPDN